MYVTVIMSSDPQAEALLAGGADPNLDNGKDTMLNVAVGQANQIIVKLLLEVLVQRSM